MKKMLSALAFGALLLAGCAKEYDDSALKNRVTTLENEFQRLERAVTGYNEEVSALRKTVEAVENGDYIKSVEKLADGFTVVLAKGGTYTIKNGTDGQNGTTPTIEIKDGYWWINGKKTDVKAVGTDGANGKTPTVEIKDGFWWINGEKTSWKAVGEDGKDATAPIVSVKEEDGVYYWTVNGQYPDGKKIRVTAAQPKFRINEETHNWEVDYGEGWVVAGPAQTTAGGDQIRVVPNEEEGYVDFILLSGTSVRVPMEKGFALVIDADAVISAGETLEIPYTVKNATKATVVDAFAGGNLEAAVEEAEDKASGKVLVTAPEGGLKKAAILVWADNGAGKTSIKKVAVEGLEVSVSAVEEVPAEGGSVSVSIVSNVEVKVEDPAETWLRIDPATRSSIEKTVTFLVDANPEAQPRSATVRVLRADNGAPVQTITIAQKEKEMTLSLEKAWAHRGVAGVAGWPAYVEGCNDLDTFIRNATFDDEFVYVPKTAGLNADGDDNFDEVKIFKFKVSDGSYAGLVQRTTNPDYMAGTWASTFPVSCARVMKNTNPEINGGKDILVACNLSDGQNVRVYAWENGIDVQPKLIANFSNGRRMGDRISVSGTYQSGRIWFRQALSNSMMAWLTVTNGTTPSWGFDALGEAPYGDAESMGEFTPFGNGNFGLVATNSGVGLHLVEGKNEIKLYPDLKRCFGWSPFEFNGKKYLAFLHMAGGTNLPILTVLEGASSTKDELQATLDAYKVAVRVNLCSDTPDDFETTLPYATNNQGDCSVRIIDGVPYILGATRGAMGVYKMVLK